MITGVPENNWELNWPAGTCVDIIPMDDDKYVARVYGFNDAFRGDLNNDSTHFLGKPFLQWLTARNLSLNDIEHTHDLQAAGLFLAYDTLASLVKVLRWLVSEPTLTE